VFKVKMYPALNGDCFLIRGAGANFLIDGGYADTFEQHLKPDLLQIAQEGERLDLLIATHIDQDHILGVIALLEANGAASPRTLVEVAAVWFNSLRGLAVEVSTALPTAPRRLLAAISRQGYQPRSTPGAAARISARQGSSLGSIVRRGGYNWNGGDGAGCIKETTNSMDISNDAFIRVLGPTTQRLEDLHRLWIGELTKRGYAGPLGSNDELDEAFEIACNRTSAPKPPQVTQISSSGNRSLDEAYVSDRSVTNGSSISVLLTAGGTRILFLGDAWAEDTVDALKKLHDEGQSLHFHAIKVSHHGSLQNTSPELLALIDAPTYFVSSNGAIHEHPDIEVLKAIVDRPATFTRTLHFNYRSPASNALRAHQSASNAGFVVIDNSTDWVEIKE
jgi:beta-lactamase superfamily II metal-dependent hydrolase